MQLVKAFHDIFLLICKQILIPFLLGAEFTTSSTTTISSFTCAGINPVICNILCVVDMVIILSHY
jgi:hypothetical protein